MERFQRDSEAFQERREGFPTAWECFVRFGPEAPGNAAVALAYGPNKAQAEFIADILAEALNERAPPMLLPVLAMDAHTNPAALKSTPPR